MTRPSSLEFTYNSADQRLTVTDELDQVTAYTVDALDRVTSVTDRVDAETAYTFDGLGQLTSVTDALGFVTDYEYTSRGWLTKITYPDPDGAGSLGRAESTYFARRGGTRHDGRTSFAAIGHEHHLPIR